MADKINRINHKHKSISKIFKRAMALFIIVIINFNSYAAVVSSNDGSAFITKAEFDALVNDFNSRIEDYEKSIDAKIDGAIAEYLAGLATATSYILEDLIKVGRNNHSNNVKFTRWMSPATIKDVDDVSAAFYLSFGAGSSDISAGRRGYCIMNNESAWNGGLALVRYTDYSGNATNYNSSYYLVNFPFGVQDVSNNVYTGNVTDWYLQDLNRHRIHYDLTVSGAAFRAAVGRDFQGDLSANHPNRVDIDFKSGVTSVQPGSKNVRVLTNWVGRNWDALYTMTHSWTTISDDDAGNNYFLDYNLAGSISGNTSVVSYDFRDYYSPLQGKELIIQKDSPSSSSEGSKSGVAYEIKNVTANSSGVLSSTNYLKGNYNNITFNWKYNKVKVYNVNWANLVNNFYTTYFNEPYYKYYGIPICKTNKMTGEITFKLKFTNSTVGGAYPGFTYQINDVKFTNSDLPSSGVLYNETVPTGNSTYTKDIKITKDVVKDMTNGDYLYIKIQPSRNYQNLSVDTEGDILITIEA